MHLVQQPNPPNAKSEDPKTKRHRFQHPAHQHQVKPAQFSTKIQQRSHNSIAYLHQLDELILKTKSKQHSYYKDTPRRLKPQIHFQIA